MMSRNIKIQKDGDLSGDVEYDEKKIMDNAFGVFFHIKKIYERNFLRIRLRHIQR